MIPGSPRKGYVDIVVQQKTDTRPDPKYDRNKDAVHKDIRTLRTPITIESHRNDVGVSDIYQNHNSIKKQKAIKLPNMMPSLLFFAPILPIKLLIPGT